MLQNFLKYTDEPDGFSTQAFAAGLFFQQAVEDATEGDNNELTRAAVLEAWSIHDFDADGMIAPTDVGGRVASRAIVLTQVRDGEFVRIYPKKKGKFDCKKSNQATVELDLIQ